MSPFTPKDWQNAPSTATAISAEALEELREWAEAGVNGRVMGWKGEGGARRSKATLTAIDELTRLRAAHDRALEAVEDYGKATPTYNAAAADCIARVKEALTKP